MALANSLLRPSYYSPPDFDLRLPGEPKVLSFLSYWYAVPLTALQIPDEAPTLPLCLQNTPAVTE
jgi:hypothetical protein